MALAVEKNDIIIYIMIIGSKIERHDILPSTNEYATQLLAQEDVIEGTVIVAKYQTAGKGQGL